MSRRLLATTLVPAFLLAACGGSGHSTTTSLPSASSSSTVTGGQRGATSSGSASSPAGGTTATTPTKPAGGATNVRLPATFVIRAGGVLSPSTVSSPAFLAIQLSVVSGDGRPHRVELKTPKPHALSVPAGGRSSTLIPGLVAGRYVLAVDGAPRGALLIGGEPGP